MWSSRKTLRTPTLLQMEAAECGAAALGSILHFYRCYIPLATLRQEAGVSRDGSKASNVLKVAEKYGLNTKAFRTAGGDLDTFKLPAILFWNFNHFVVLESFDGDTVYINDPATGPRTITRADLEDNFSYIILTFERGPAFKPQGTPSNPFGALLHRLRGSGGTLLYAVLAGILLVLPAMAFASFSKVFVDGILIGGNLSWFKPLWKLMAMTIVLLGGLTWLQKNALLRMQLQMAIQSSVNFVWHVLRLPFAFFQQRYGGEIGARVMFNDRIAALLTNKLAANIIDVMTIAFFGFLLYHYDKALTFVAVVTATLNLLILRYTFRRKVDANLRLLQDRGKLNGIGMGGLQTIETLKSMGEEQDFFARWTGQHAKVINSEQRLGAVDVYLSALPILLAALNTALILSLGGYRVMEGWMTIGILFAFQILTQAFLSPIGSLVNAQRDFQEVEGLVTRLEDVLHHQTDPDVPADLLDEHTHAEAHPQKLQGRVDIRDLSFGYNRLEHPLIEHFNLSIEPGARVAIVGGSGSGKSTLARVISGLFAPWSGEILFDGKGRSAYPRDLMHHSVAFVEQSIFLFEGTILDNLTLWNSTIPEETVMQACKDACIHDVIMERKHGYHTHVEEGGVNFSGGERQRLEIARALANEPSILILDEATSALDPVTEEQVMQNIVTRGCTCVIIAHRLSTIRDCNEIIVLDRGQVVERGTHEDLLNAKGAYARLISKDTLKDRNP